MQIDFNNFIYSPILKWKQGEYRGLAELPLHIKDGVIPIFDMPPHGGFDHEAQRVLTPAEHITSFGSRLSSAWGGRPCFVDAGKIDTQEYRAASNGTHPLIALFERAHLFTPRGLCAPVTALNRSDEYQSAVCALVKKEAFLPVCIRISLSDIDAGAIEIKLQTLMTSIGTTPERTVLVIDGVGMTLSETAMISELLVQKLNDLPYLYRWMSLVLSLCAIPEDLKVLPNSTVVFPRADWIIFNRLYEEHKSGSLLRLPLFSDYGIENSTFPPSAPVRPATQIRYSTSTDFYFFKGENTKTAGYEGIFSVAQQLKKSGVFMGGDFSAGDFAIERLATAAGKTGNASCWKKFGIIHHITLVDREVRGLLGIPPAAVEIETSEKQLELLDELTSV